MRKMWWSIVLLALLLAGCAASQPGVEQALAEDVPAAVTVEQQPSPVQKEVAQLQSHQQDDRPTMPQEEQVPAPPVPAESQTPEQEEIKPAVEDRDGAEEPEEESAAVVEEATLKEEAAALQASPAAVPILVQSAASGTLVEENGSAAIDYSNTAEGYVMVRYTQNTGKRVKAQVSGPTTVYTYNITPEKWEAFPLSDGNGTYKITVYENVVDSKYAAVISITHSVTLENEFAPFLHPNQYVDYSKATKTVAKAAQITAGCSDTLQKVKAVYDYVVENLSYDQQRAATVKSGYLPELDSVLEEGKGICFDYAALMTGMLRSQGIPSKLVVGYAGETYHAWISVWTQESGWMDSAIYFDGNVWKRMDPTFASSGERSDSIMAYIGDGANYKGKYFY